MPKPVKVWLPAFMRFISLVRITSKEAEEPVPIIPYEGQKRFLKELTEGLESGIHHFTVLKSRQLGLSTIMLALDIFWLYMHPGLQGALIADTSENREAFRQTITEMLDSLPPRYRVKVVRHNRGALVLANGSRLQYMNAGKQKNSGLGRSRALNYVHACCAPGTPVIVEDGRVKLIEDVRVGDVVLTHTGERTVIVDAIGQPNTKGDLIKITPWLGQALSFTGEHTIPTQRGIIEAKDVRKDDWLVMPIRPITKEVTSIALPKTPGAGRVSVGSGAILDLDEEFGFTCGYYLAEGSVIFQPIRNGVERPSGIQFARHRSERHYANRALAPIWYITSGHRTLDRADSLTTVEYAYGASFAAWINQTFGSREGKIIPDEVFTWGEDFCRGLLSGLLSGDGSKTVRTSPTKVPKYKPRLSRNGKPMGQPRKADRDLSKTYEINQVVLPSTRASFAMQARDMAASLGYGWPGTKYRPAGHYYGRNCKGIWSLVWNGDAAARLRPLMGCEAVPNGPRASTQKYKIEDGAVWIKIRKIETGIKCDTIYDLSVAHEDHTFRTPFMSIGNTECSSWGDQKGLDSLRHALAETNTNRLYCFESTALGYNLFYDMWEEAKKDPAQRAIFVGWWAKNVNQHAEGTPEYDRWWGEDPTLSEEEASTAEQVERLYGWKITSEQWAWYRNKFTLAGDEASFLEEQPSTAEESFQATGNSFFSLRRVNQDMELLTQHGVAYTGYKYTLGKNFLKMAVEETRIPDEVDLKVWEEPVKGAKYVIGVDPAYGADEDRDRSTIEVWRCYSDRLVQVAEFNTPMPTTRQCAWAMAHLAGCFRDCIINLEITGPGGEVMHEIDNIRQQISFGQLRDIAPSLNTGFALDMARWYLYHRPDSMGPGYMYNWKQSFENKQRLLNRMRDCFDTEQLTIRSMMLLDEMTKFVQDGGKLHASGRNKDDRVMATSLANFAWTEWVRPGMMVEGRTFEVEQAKEQEKSLRGGRVVDWLIPLHFENAAKRRSDEELQRIMDL